MKKIKEYNPITIEEALQILKESKGEPVSNFVFGQTPGKWLCSGELTSVEYPSFVPFRSSLHGRYAHCAKVSKRYPNEISSNITALPEPYLAYIMKGPIPEDRRPTEEERGEFPLWALSLRGWQDSLCRVASHGDSLAIHYALDIRTAYAKRVWPEIVEAMEYQEPLQWKGGINASKLNKSNMRKQKIIGGKEYTVFGSTIEREGFKIVSKSYTTGLGKVTIENGVVTHPDGKKTTGDGTEILTQTE